MKAALSKPRLGSRGRPEESRAAILQAAVREFSREGVAGARTDAIARAAGVNKALLYYYFKDKETLYGAVLDQVFGGLTAEHREGAVQRPAAAGKIAGLRGRALRLHRQSSPLSQNHAGRNDARGPRQSAASAAHCEAILSFRCSAKSHAVIEEGQAAGDFRPVDPMHFVPSMIAIIVFHFINAPVLRMVRGIDPLAPELVAARRAAVLDFISAALFTQQANSKGERK